jgi:GT2 family glycosyltransferase
MAGVANKTPASPAPIEISVICPTYRRSDRLRRLIAALEDQDLERGRFEVVIVDDTSPDDTAAVAAELIAASPLTMRYLTTGVNQGPAAGRNLGWRSSTAPLMAFVDDDCVPRPGWLRAGLAVMQAQPDDGVVQGHTMTEEGPMGDWTVFRQIEGPTPYFEACNIFYRRDALEATGGFDEKIAWYGEDTALGWAVVDAGWGRGFADAAVVVHDLEDRGLRWHVRNGFLEGHLVEIAARHPRLATEGFWRPYAFHEWDVRTAIALAGVLGAAVQPATLVLVYPWYRMRRPPPSHHRFLRLIGERAAVDSARVAGMLVASIRHRRLVI